MPPFRDEDNSKDLDLFQVGPVHLYQSRATLDRDLAELRLSGYDIRECDLESVVAQGGIHRVLSRMLDFPDYYGHNLNALYECLCDLRFEHRTGMVVVLRNVDDYVRLDENTANSLCEVFRDASWDHLLFGRRLLFLLHSQDPRATFGDQVPICR